VLAPEISILEELSPELLAETAKKFRKIDVLHHKLSFLSRKIDTVAFVQK